MESIEAQLISVVRQIKCRVVPEIVRVTIPIWGVQNDKVVHDRTGVLYTVAGHHFILTASHDLREIVKAEIPLYMQQRESEQLPLPLTKCQFHTTEHDSRDIAVISLPSDFHKRIMGDTSFLHHNKVDLYDNDPDGIYLLVGYPMEWFKTPQGELPSKPLSVLCMPFRHEIESELVCYEPNIHIGLSLRRQEVYSESELSCLPKLEGISGCGIWRVGDYTSEGIRGWTAQEWRLVGLEHTVSDEKGFVLGTRIGYVLGLLLTHYPELEPAMSLCYLRR